MGRREGCAKPSVTLAILISSAVRIKAIKVELKWTELSSATGKSIRNSLCEKSVRDMWERGCTRPTGET